MNVNTKPKMQPLKGIRVLDISRVLAGPSCTQTLGTLGAEVIKIEPIGTGDEMRQWPPMRADTGTPFLAYNRNKKSLALDLKSPAALALVHRLAAISDVFVESGSTGASERLGLGYAAVQHIRADVIYCAISGFGQTGPLKNAKGYDLMLQAFSGMMAMTGEADGGPVRSAFSPIDQATGQNAVIGILSAVIQRAQTGQGALVEVSLLESATQLLSYHLQSFWETGKLPAKIACGHPALVPYQPFETADQPILIGIANDSLWRTFCREFALDVVASDPRFATNPKRVENRAQVVAIVQEQLRGQSAAELVARLIACGVPCSPIHDLKNFSDHRQLDALGMFIDYVHPSLGMLKAVAQPIMFDGKRETPQMPPPRLGQHTREVLGLIGCSHSEIDGYLANGVAAESTEAP
jgi:crotonobetainyl-CoA:carnitine CoA-transferase CaiB-like acyl-CoA transferase